MFKFAKGVLVVALLVTGDVYASERQNTCAGSTQTAACREAGQDEAVQKQRQLYLEAMQLARKGSSRRLDKLKASIEEYPLYPYVLYTELRNSLSRQSSAQIDAFTEAYPDTHLAQSLESAWLKQLARRGHWKTFSKRYNKQSSKELRCHAVNAAIKTGQQPGAEAKALWTVAFSQPKACDPVFAWLKRSGQMDDDLIWQRLEKAMTRNQRLAAYLAKQLKSTRYRQQYQRWLALRKRPEKIFSKTYRKDNDFNREMAIYAVKRQLIGDLETAEDSWLKLKKQYRFTRQELASTERLLGLRKAQRHYDGAADYIAQLPAESVDQTIREWQVRSALREQKWGDVNRYILNLPEEEAKQAQWRYWLARSEEVLGRPEQAKALYQSLARQRSYYGFMSAERLGQAYQFNNATLPLDPQHTQQIKALPEVQRVQELLHHREIHHARREWNRLLNRLSESGIRTAASLASDWGWHETAIRSVARIAHYDDLELRFPQPHSDARLRYSKEHQVDPDWAYAIMRRESALASDARSGANARGLMQLLPSTARGVARSKGWRWRGVSALNQADTNIRYGTAYLAELFERFDGEMVLATAAYNAGPHRVDKWLPKHATLPMDVWIDTIPFEETRKYVKVISEYRNIVRWLEQGQPDQFGAQLQYASRNVTGDILASNP